MDGLDVSKVQDGELFKWDKVGLKVAGILRSYRPQKTGKGDGHVYEVQTKDGTIAFFASQLLHKKLQGVPVGNVVVIEYTHDSKTGAGNTLKNFEVSQGKPSEANLKALGLELLEEVEGEF